MRDTEHVNFLGVRLELSKFTVDDVCNASQQTWDRL